MQLLDDRLTRPTKMSLFFFGDNFYKNHETLKIFSPDTGLDATSFIEQNTWRRQA